MLISHVDDFQLGSLTVGTRQKVAEVTSLANPTLTPTPEL